jgi:hypothetical protein
VDTCLGHLLPAPDDPHFTRTDTTITSSYGPNFGRTAFSAAFAAAAAIVLVVIIRKVSAGPVGHPRTPGVPSEVTGDIATG